jgi:hypothetical protein
METITDTPDRLVLEDRPSGISVGIVIVAVSLVALGIVVLRLENVPMDEDAILPPRPTLIIGGIFVGIYYLWGLGRHVQLWLDRPAGRIALRSRHLFGFRESSFDLAHLTRCETRKIMKRGMALYRPVLVFGGPSAKIVPIFPAYRAGDWAEDTTSKINAWLMPDRS